jgi:siroheme synthase
MKIYVVGIGAGSADGMTFEARNVLEKADVIVGYTVYAELVKKLFPENTVGKLQGERNGHTATQTNRILYIISHLYAEIFIKLIVKMSYDTQLYPVTITFLQIYFIKFIHHTPRIREKFSR